MNQNEKQRKLLVLEDFQDSFNALNYDPDVLKNQNYSFMQILFAAINIYKNNELTKLLDETSINDLPDILKEKNTRVADLLNEAFREIESINHEIKFEIQALSEKHQHSQTLKN